jgi:hypothetical protein
MPGQRRMFIRGSSTLAFSSFVAQFYHWGSLVSIIGVSKTIDTMKNAYLLGNGTLIADNV